MACHLSGKAYTGEVCHVPSCAMLRATFCQRKDRFRLVFCAKRECRWLQKTRK